MREIKTDQENIQAERDEWKKVKSDPTLARDTTLTAKKDAEAKLAKAGLDITHFRNKLEVAEGKITLAEERANQYEEQWFAKWQTT